MAIIRVHNKARNITYVYESESYWDKELKQPRSHRRLIGRIDPVTGEIVPTAKRTGTTGRKDSSQTHSDITDYKTLYEQALSTIKEKDALILELQSKLAAAENDIRDCRCVITKACDILAPASGKEQADG